MVEAWKESYRGLAGSAEERTLFSRDLRAEIEEFVLPYVSRLQACGQITSGEAAQFVSFCENQAVDLGP